MQRTKKYVGSEAPGRGVQRGQEGEGGDWVNTLGSGGRQGAVDHEYCTGNDSKACARPLCGCRALQGSCGGDGAQNGCETGAIYRYWVTGKEKCSRV